ncbi:hypothetical protein ACFWNG_05015 [Streptomyces sp. NPDC058391]|uniref:hypothetical protein n=1 Tax=Streptomyces sp. NPDC058391 TaxID=3346476 RepID=UPI0036491ED5
MPTDVPPLPERLLILAGTYTRHNDALAADGPTPVPGLQADIPATERLTETVLSMIDAVRSQPLVRTLDVRDVEIQLRQLAFLTSAAADHLLNAREITDAARAESPDNTDPYHSSLRARTDAARQVQTAFELTALGPATSADAAEALAAAMRRQRLDFASAGRQVNLSAAQHTALRAVARGHVEIYEAAGRHYANSHDDRLLLTTLRSLESKQLIQYEDRPGSTNRRRAHLTATGRQTLTAGYGLPQPNGLRTRAAPKPAATTTSPARTR